MSSEYMGKRATTRQQQQLRMHAAEKDGHTAQPHTHRSRLYKELFF
jgi:hypothetical protein